LQAFQEEEMTYIANPAYLWLLLLLPFAVALYIISGRKKRKAAMKFSSLQGIKLAQGKKSWRKDITFYLAMLALVLLVLALADPHLPLKNEKKGVNVVLVIDISGSMQATDYAPSRIEAAKASAEILLRSLKANDYAGIVVFESGATTAAYLSPSKGNVIDKLEAISPKQGRTAIGDGLLLGIDMATSIPNKRNVVILLSDGVNNDGVVQPAEAVSFAKSAQIQVNTIGMGSDGQAIIGYDMFGRPQYAELDEATLQAIAEQTGGMYYKSVDEKTLADIYSRISEDIEREKEDTSIKSLLIFSAILSLALEFYIRHGRYRILSG
jgi:Ca-activated chloride channel homolog